MGAHRLVSDCNEPGWSAVVAIVAFIAPDR
jgi:hypothetical protein